MGRSPPRKTDMRVAMNAILYLLRTGCPWRYLPAKKGGGKNTQVAYDAGNQVKARKIHALVDSEGLPMRVVVHSAAIQDRDGAGLILDKIPRRFPWLELIWADGGHNVWQLKLR